MLVISVKLCPTINLCGYGCPKMMRVDITHVTSHSRPSHFSVFNIEKLGMGLGTRLNESTKVQTLSTMNLCCEYAMYYSLEVIEHVAKRSLSAVCNNIQTVLDAMCSGCCLWWGSEYHYLFSYTQSASVSLCIKHLCLTKLPVSYYHYVQCDTTHVRSLKCVLFEWTPHVQDCHVYTR